MLEPLIVLTVLNCFFMFSSTVTTCALWWQYRSHRCCFRKDVQQRASKHDFDKSRSNCTCRTTRKAGRSKFDRFVDVITSSKSRTAVNRESKSNRAHRQKSRTNLKYLSQFSKQNAEKQLSKEIMTDKSLEGKMKMSEASQTANDAKPTVVMEYSTVQKVVQILDNENDLSPAKLPLKDLNFKKDPEDKERKVDFDTKHKSHVTSSVAQSKN